MKKLLIILCFLVPFFANSQTEGVLNDLNKLITGVDGQVLYYNSTLHKWDTIPHVKLYFDGDSLLGNVKGTLGGITVGNADSLNGELPIYYSDSMYISYCNGCALGSKWVAMNDTFYIDTAWTAKLNPSDTTNLSDSLRLAWLQKANKADSTTVSETYYITVTNPTPNDYVVGLDSATAFNGIKATLATKVNYSDTTSALLATATKTGFLNSTDWNTFNNKLALSDSTGNFITPYDTTNKWKPINATDSLYISWLASWKNNGDTVTADTGKVNTTGNDTIWGSTIFTDTDKSTFIQTHTIQGRMIGDDYGYVLNPEDGLIFTNNLFAPNGLSINRLTLKNVNSGFTSILNFRTLTADHDLYIPDSSGTIALMQNVNAKADTSITITNASNGYMTVAGNNNKSLRTNLTIALDSTVAYNGIKTTLGAKADSSAVPYLNQLNTYSNKQVFQDKIILTSVLEATTPAYQLVLEGDTVKKDTLIDINEAQHQHLHTDTLTVGGLQMLVFEGELIDDAYYDLPTGFSGMGIIYIGDFQEWARFGNTKAGAVTLIDNSTNVVDSNTDANLCVFDNGTNVRISNRLGSTLFLKGSLIISQN